MLADQLDSLIVKMKESDLKMQQLIDDHVVSVNQFIENTESICSESDPVQDAIELLESQGYQVIPASK